MKKTILFLTVPVIFLTNLALGQTKIYNSKFEACEKCKSINDFGNKLGIEIYTQQYQINDEFIVELYKKGTGKFVGFVADTSKFEIKDLRHFEQDERMKYLLSKYIEPYAVAIYNEKVKIGMSPEHVRESWGKPNEINRTITQNKTREQWVYGNGNYLYFEDSTLVTIQN